MSKYKIHEIVKYDKQPGLFVITQIDEGSSNLEYSIMHKNAFDNWVPEKLETLPKVHESFTSVSESEISKPF
jgi:hypothetical protein